MRNSDFGFRRSTYRRHHARKPGDSLTRDLFGDSFSETGGFLSSGAAEQAKARGVEQSAELAPRVSR